MLIASTRNPIPLYGTMSYLDAARADLVQYEGWWATHYFYPPIQFAS